MEIVVIGGIAAGMSAAAKAVRTNKEANVTVIEKEAYVSFGACGLPYYLGNQFIDPNEMFARTPEQVEAQGVKLLLQHEVTGIDYESKQLEVKDLTTQRNFKKPYDRLMIASGASPIIPSIKGIDSPNVFSITRLESVDKLKAQLHEYQEVVVVGGGFIGVEVSDQLAVLGKKVTVIEAMDQLLGGPFDKVFGDKIEEALVEEAVEVRKNERVEELIVGSEGHVTHVVTSKASYQADAVIIAVGFNPNTSFTGDKLNKLANGAILIDKYGETSIQDVYSGGDCATVPHRLLGDTYIPLATTANKLGRLIGTNIAVDREERQAYVGALGSSAIKAGQYEAASTGLTERQAKAKGLNVKTTCIETYNHSNYYTVQEKIMIQLVYDAASLVLYGAQLFGKNETVLRATGLTTAIHAGLTTKEIGFIDYAYAPPFASTWEAINVAANTAK